MNVVGKDILRFHAVHWPVLLLVADLPIPNRMYANGFQTNDGEKMIKYQGNIIEVDPTRMKCLVSFEVDECAELETATLLEGISILNDNPDYEPKDE